MSWSGLVIVGRTGAASIASLDEAITRAKAYDATGVDALFFTEFYKFKIFLVVEEHLGGDVFGACLDLGLQEHDVRFQVRGFKVFFGISCNPYTEICFAAVFYILFLV